VREKAVPLIICTSKTRAEILYWREKLRNTHPFVSENGGGVFVPAGYFGFEEGENPGEDGFRVVVLGTPRKKLLEFFRELKKDFSLRGFHEMTAEEVARETGLPLHQAELARRRDFDEPFKILDGAQTGEVLERISRSPWNCLAGGRYFHLVGGHDKGRAVRTLLDLYRKKYGQVESVAVGDSGNDFAMLDTVDRGYLVSRKDGTYASPAYRHAGGAGPRGWNRVILEELGREEGE